jgi:hypothetical protein
MKYAKPTIAALGVASNAIQAFHSKLIHNVTDSMDPSAARTSGGAYDLDE